jgi:chitinase
VPRDAGEETQVRIDYSNEKGYWDAIVGKAADKKRRRARSLQDFDGDHQRWLEHAWAEDHKGGLLTRDELHARWFGSDIIDWLQGLFSVAEAAPAVTHSVSETLSVLLLQEQYSCNLGGVDVEAKLDVQADLDLTIDTSFGLAIINPRTGQSYAASETRASAHGSAPGSLPRSSPRTPTPARARPWSDQT